MKRGPGAVVILGVVLLSVAGAIWGGGGSGGRTLPSAGGEAVGLIRVEGSITDGADGLGMLGSGSAEAEAIVKQLDQGARDPSVKAVVMRVNSPGGSASASWEVAEAVRRVKEAGKPVVVSMGDTAASGGYWIAAAADQIVATPSTMTGSIGVILQTANMAELYDKIGYRPEVLKTGPYKDIGSPSREMLPEERQILETMINETYEEFIQTVAEGRGLDPAKVRSVADGRVISGRQALDLGLVDELGDMHRAVRLAGELAGIHGEPAVRELGSGLTPLDALFGLEADAPILREVLGRLLLGQAGAAGDWSTRAGLPTGGVPVQSGLTGGNLPGAVGTGGLTGPDAVARPTDLR